jgi:hypothetical protein
MKSRFYFITFIILLSVILYFQYEKYKNYYYLNSLPTIKYLNYYRIDNGPYLLKDGTKIYEYNPSIFQLKNGDIITIDAFKGTINFKISKSEFQKRKKAWKNISPHFLSGTLWKYGQTVGSAKNGAVTHAGGFKEKKCYADI